MYNLKKSKKIIFCVLFIWLSVLLALISIYPVFSFETKTIKVLDTSFNLTQSEILRYGLGSFRDGEAVSIYVNKTNESFLNFSILTYNDICYSNSSKENIYYSFVSSANYYEASFYSPSSDIIEINFEVLVQKNQVSYPYEFLNFIGMMLFLFGIAFIALILLRSHLVFGPEKTFKGEKKFCLTHKKKMFLLLLILFSLSFWFVIIIGNNNSHASFENWYTDHARHPYSSSLFTKFGFSIFNTPLGELSSNDMSFYKFVTWPQMPHLYPIGSILLFLPFGLLLQNGLNQILVFKLEIIIFLVFSHIGLFFFVSKFWKKRMFILFKLIGIYALYVPLIVYSANGMFDGIPFLFSLIAIDLFLAKKYDFFLFFIGFSSFFKYQTLIFLFPLVIVALLKFLQNNSLLVIYRNKALLAGIILIGSTLATASLSVPLFLESNNLSVMNGINAFNPHSQITWIVQSIAVLSTASITLVYSIYFLDKNPVLTLSSIFLLIPSFILTYFQIWYLPFFFIYTLVPQKKRNIEITFLWILFIIFILSFGAISFNPINVINGWRQVLGI